MTSIWKNVYTDKLDHIVNKYNNSYHRIIKMKLVAIKSTIYMDFNKENNKEDHKFKVGYNARISKYKNIFAKSYVLNWSKEVFVIKKVKNTVSWAYVIHSLNGEEILGTFYKKELWKTNEKEFRVEKVIKRNMLYLKWNHMNNMLNVYVLIVGLIKKT